MSHILCRLIAILARLAVRPGRSKDLKIIVRHAAAWRQAESCHRRAADPMQSTTNATGSGCLPRSGLCGSPVDVRHRDERCRLLVCSIGGLLAIPDKDVAVPVDGHELDDRQESNGPP